MVEITKLVEGELENIEVKMSHNCHPVIKFQND